MRDRSNKVSDDIVELTRDAIENKFLKNSVFHVAKVIAYNKKNKSVVVPLPDKTIREVPFQNNDVVSAHVKPGTNVLVMNPGFPSQTHDKSYAILYNNKEIDRSPPGPEEATIQRATQAIRNEYSSQSVEEVIAEANLQQDLGNTQRQN